MEQLRNGDALRDFVLFVLPVYLPFYQGLLAESVARVILSLLLALLLLFLVQHKEDIVRVLGRFVLAGSWAQALFAATQQIKRDHFDPIKLLTAPLLSAPFQRPPPLFA